MCEYIHKVVNTRGQITGGHLKVIQWTLFIKPRKESKCNYLLDNYTL